MVTFVYEANQVTVPSWVVDLESFRRWADADDFPEFGRICYLKGQVWIDMSKEQVFTHVAVRHEIGFQITALIKAGLAGQFFPDGLFLSNEVANLAVVPDGTYVSDETLASGRARLIEGADEGYVELEGTPDMVLEVISRSSVNKDRVILRQAYWEARIPEYWLVDARKEPLTFDIFRHGVRGYVPARKQDGCVKSSVFGKSFRLTRTTNKLGNPVFTLEVR